MDGLSRSSKDDGCGSKGGQRQHGMNWKRLLLEGPGEVPGRDEAIVRAMARSAEKRLVGGGKAKRRR